MKPFPVYKCDDLRFKYGSHVGEDVEVIRMLSGVKSYVILLLCYNCVYWSLLL